MRYNPLGSTGLFVSELCLGTMTFGGQSTWNSLGNSDQSEATAIVSRALEAGVNIIDTANNYSGGLSEKMVGQALKDIGIKRSDVLIATKCFARIGQGPNDMGSSRGHIMDCVERSLERLGLDHIDLYQMHAQDSMTPIEETLRALDDLVSRGLVRYVGASNYQAWQLMKAQGIAERKNFVRFQTLQAYYSIASRDIEREIVPALVDQKMGLMVYSPLAGGLLSGKFERDKHGPEGARRSAMDFPLVHKDRAWDCIDAMREVAQSHDVSVARVALAYVLAKPFVTSIIIGAKRIDQLEDNLAAIDVQLSAEDLAKLDAVSELPFEYPGWALGPQEKVRRPQPK
ncbi:aldo/keto reductase [Sphingobium sp. CFD-2]|uniref:aldo/keto reductase n=1 Tax=Sphingobium sp. CFD-2 TaxID=2878542 RepID=UPI00214ABB10|nr:aldo/keto reductase [Sphingobium sp. CFD-2]